jgi:hypothetical protein
MKLARPKRFELDIRKDVGRLVATAIEEHRQEKAEVARLVDEAEAA